MRTSEDIGLSVRLGYFAARLTDSPISGSPVALAWGDVIRERLRAEGLPEDEIGILRKSGLEPVYAR